MSRARANTFEISSGEDQEANGSVGTALEAGNEAVGVEGNGGGSPEYASGNTPGGVVGDEDDRIIRDENGNPTYSPTGRIRKRRSRTSASERSDKSAKNAKVSVKELEEQIDTNAGLIFGGHLFVAKVGKVPEMELNTDEAQMLSEAFTPILSDSGIKPPKWMRDINKIIIACSYVYGPRFKMIGDRMKEEKEERARAKAAAGQRQIVPIGGVEPPIFKPTIMTPGPLDHMN